MKIKTTEKTSYHSPEKKPQGIQDSTLPNFLGVFKLQQKNGGNQSMDYVLSTWAVCSRD